MSQASSATGGVSIIGLLGVVFITLKLTGYIDWSWWWVTAPFWGTWALILVVVAVALIIAHLSQRRPHR